MRRNIKPILQLSLFTLAAGVAVLTGFFAASIAAFMGYAEWFYTVRIEGIAFVVTAVAAFFALADGLAHHYTKGKPLVQAYLEKGVIALGILAVLLLYSPLASLFMQANTLDAIRQELFPLYTHALPSYLGFLLGIKGLFHLVLAAVFIIEEKKEAAPKEEDELASF